MTRNLPREGLGKVNPHKAFFKLQTLLYLWTHEINLSGVEPQLKKY